MARSMIALGLMSGTSMDGIDAAIIKTDGVNIEEFGPTHTTGFSTKDRALLMQAVGLGSEMTGRHDRPGLIAHAEDFITGAHVNVVNDLLRHEGLRSADIDIIGFHGQTVFHRPEKSLTVQIGDGARLAAMTGIDVVSDFRAADMEAGGQGAPLAPVFHRAMLQYSGFDGVGVCVNIGGISNITWISPTGHMIAFDTGPGNVLLDQWCQDHLNEPFDRDGRLAASGCVHKEVLETLLLNPYFSKPYPKSLDKTDFDPGALEGLNVRDGAATLAAFSAETIAMSQAHMPQLPEKWIICGGGRLNGAIMAQLQQRIDAPVISAEAAGFSGGDIEAQAFAYLAVRSLNGLPLSFPGTTGVTEPTCGGTIYRI